MKKFTNPSPETWSDLVTRPQLELGFLDSGVRNIMNRVKKSGDYALKELTMQFDKTEVQHLKVTPGELIHAENLLDENLKRAINTAADNIEKFHSAQKREIQKIETTKGVTCWRKGVAIDKVGIYIPGGSAPLFSTVLMLGVPAKLAGCRETILCTPPDKSGNVNPAILFAANLVGITQIFKVGGAQAIAAMTYGTETIPSVYKIFGPGNQYVTKAKQLATENGVAIDMPAGPSEVLVFADDSANPAFVAADLLSQAEHGEDSQVMLVSMSEPLIAKIQHEIEHQLQTLPRKQIAGKALASSCFISFNDMTSAIAFVNAYAPEHLILNLRNADDVAERVVNAGSVFLGNYTPEAIGDYASGTNHTLPTNGYARAYAGVSLESFMKYITFQQATPSGLKNLGPIVELMARAEDLVGHQRAITVRLDEINKPE